MREDKEDKNKFFMALWCRLMSNRIRSFERWTCAMNICTPFLISSITKFYAKEINDKKYMVKHLLIVIKRFHIFPHQLEIKFDLFMRDNIVTEKLNKYWFARFRDKEAIKDF